MKQFGSEMDGFLDADDELLSPHEKEEEKKWEREFERRKTELDEQKKLMEERKRQSSSRLEKLSIRWRNLEQRRVQRNYLKRNSTTIQSDLTSAPSLPERGTTVM